jgi:hypothetical protein
MTVLMTVISTFFILLLHLSWQMNSVGEMADCAINDYRRTSPNYGWHVICLRLTGINNYGYEEIAVTLLKDGQDDIRLSYRKPVGDAGPLNPFLLRIAELTGSSVPSIVAWKVFDEGSHRLRSVDRIIEAGVAFVVSGGRWMWPAKYIGFDQYDFHYKYRLLTLSTDPLSFYIPNFLNATQVQQIVEIAPTLPRADASSTEVNVLAKNIRILLCECRMENRILERLTLIQ